MKQQSDERDEREKVAEEEDEEGTRKKYPDMLDLLFYFEQTGVGLPRHEMVLLNLSIRKLVSEVPVENIRYSTLGLRLSGLRDVTSRNCVTPCPTPRILLILICVQLSGFGARYSENPKIITWWRRNFRRMS